MGSFSRRNWATFPKTPEGLTIIFLLRRRKGLIFKEEPGHFTHNPGGFYNNISFKKKEGLIFKAELGHAF